MGLYQRIGPSAMEAEDLYLLGLALTRAGKTKSAIEVWERARSLDPEHSESLFELTRAYFANDPLDHAARLASVLATRPGWESRAEAILGMIQLERNDPAGAAEYWQSALGRKEVRLEGVPSPIVPRKELAHALLRVGRSHEARDQFKIVLGEVARSRGLLAPEPRRTPGGSLGRGTRGFQEGERVPRRESSAPRPVSVRRLIALRRMPSRGIQSPAGLAACPDVLPRLRARWPGPARLDGLGPVGSQGRRTNSVVDEDSRIKRRLGWTARSSTPSSSTRSGRATAG